MAGTLRYLTRSSAILTLLIGTAISTTDTGRDLSRLGTPQVSAGLRFASARLEFTPVAAVCSDDAELALRPSDGDSGSPGQLVCTARSERKVRIAAPGGCYCAVIYSSGPYKIRRCYSSTKTCDYYYYLGVLYSSYCYF